MGKIHYNWKPSKLNEMKSFLLTLIFILLGTTLSYSQAREGGSKPPAPPVEKGFDFDRIRYGGGFGATFGDITYVELSPTIGYLLTDRLLAGFGGRYIYFSDNVFNYSTNVYGGNVFSQYALLDFIVAHTEVEVLNLDDRFRPNERVNVTSVLVGGGYRSQIGDRSFANLLLLFNLTEDINTPYTNPIFRITFGF